MYFRYVMSVCAIAVLAGCATGSQNAGSVGIRMSDVDANVFGGKSASRFGLNSPNDMWERVQRGFSMPDLDNSVVRDREAWYTRNPDNVNRMLGRSNKYIYHVVEELERRRMPTELALLPFVESAFNPQAVSSAKAAGMWQFIPSTGKQYELAQNRFQDDRRDVLNSTRAALDYLQRLYTMFGDWHLALAAYNWGEGNVQRAIQRNLAAGRGTAYAELNMPQETRQYVPKLQAIKNIIRNPATFNTALPNVANHPYFDQVKISRDIDVATAAKLAEISVDDFKALNPSLNKPMVIASLTPRILLPWHAAPRFRENLARVGNTKIASWTLWTAPSTMSIAQAAKQSGATEEQLRELNRIPPRMMVKAGSTLLVPRPDWHTSDISSTVAKSSSVSFAPEVAMRRITLEARQGDTVASFAARNGVSAQDVANWNNTTPNAALQEDQAVVLKLPQQQANRLLNQQRAEEALAEREARQAARERQREETSLREERTRKAREAEREHAQARQAASRKQRVADEDEEEEDTPPAKARKKNPVDDRASRPAKPSRKEDDEDKRPAKTVKAAAKPQPVKAQKAPARTASHDDEEEDRPARAAAKDRKKATARDDDERPARAAGKTKDKPAAKGRAKEDDDASPVRPAAKPKAGAKAHDAKPAREAAKPAKGKPAGKGKER